jgi:23S rRNA pseudouridine2605 synthase
VRAHGERSRRTCTSIPAPNQDTFLNQEQLQTARAALWRHSNPLVTLDDAAAWLDEIGLSLFLPRHAQLPAPAPSFAEAVLGAPSALPAPSAIAQATDLATRLHFAGRAIPLNLLGTFSEQPDFLVTPDVLPWVAAIRGDRQWKAAPAGRTAPIVVRTWAALDQHGPLTAVEIRQILGRELTEAAVLRALIELWTTLRATPAYAEGEPTRWSLLKNRYASQLATAANTALPTALSALLSIYLRSAVAATAEEAEIFLSPLTARSRIREVLHGMTAARRFGTLSLGSHTLLFVEGSLPETPVEATPDAAPAPAAPPPPSAPRRPFGEKSAPRPPFREKSAPRREFSAQRPPFRDRSSARSFQKQRDDGPRDRQFPSRRDERPAAKFQRQDARPRFQRREGPPERPRRDDRPAAKFPRRDDRAPRRDDRPAAQFRPQRDERPWQKDRRKPWVKPGEAGPRGGRPRAETRPPFGKDDKPPQAFAPPRRKPFAGKPGFGGNPKFSGAPDRGPRDARGGTARPGPRGRKDNRSDARPFSQGKFGSRPPQKFRGDRPAARFGKGPEQDKPRFGQAPRPGKPRFGQRKDKPGFSPAGRSSRFGAGRPAGKPFRKNNPKTSAPRDRKPRKNRNQEESAE